MIFGWIEAAVIFVFIGFVTFLIVWVASIGAAVGEKHTGLVVLLIFVPIIGVPVALLTLDNFQENPAEYAARKEREQKVAEANLKRAVEEARRQDEVAQERLKAKANQPPPRIMILEIIYFLICLLVFPCIAIVIPLVLGFGERLEETKQGGFWIFLLPAITTLTIAIGAKFLFPIKSKNWGWVSRYTFWSFVATGAALVLITLWSGIACLSYGNSHFFDLTIPSLENLQK